MPTEMAMKYPRCFAGAFSIVLHASMVVAALWLVPTLNVNQIAPRTLDLILVDQDHATWTEPEDTGRRQAGAPVVPVPVPHQKDSIAAITTERRAATNEAFGETQPLAESYEPPAHAASLSLPAESQAVTELLPSTHASESLSEVAADSRPSSVPNQEDSPSSVLPTTDEEEKPAPHLARLSDRAPGQDTREPAISAPLGWHGNDISNESLDEPRFSTGFVPPTSSSGGSLSKPIFASRTLNMAGGPKVVEAQAIYNPRPVYPRLAREVGWEGTVQLRVDVGINGEPSAVRLKRSSGHEVLDQAAIEAVKGWRFRPAQDGLFPVRSSLQLHVVFKLNAS